MRLLEKTYEASAKSIRDIHVDLKVCLLRLGYCESEQDPFLLCASEIFTNALKHTNRAPTSFKVLMDIHGNKLLFQLIDDGFAFKNFETKHQASKEQSATMKHGVLETSGIGLFLAGRDFTDFTYTRMEEWNHYSLSAPSPFLQQKPSVLIIDDDPAQLDLLTLYISTSYSVQQAVSGQSAMEWLNKTESPPNLILCDVIMQDGNGVDFCLTLQKSKDLALIPFIFMTGTPENLTAKTAENLPVNDFLTKPVRKENLLKIIKRTLSKASQDQRIIGERLDKDITSILSPALPDKIGDYNMALKWQAAEAGGGDIVLHLKGDNCDHIVVMDIMGHGAQAKFFSHSFIGYLNGFLSAQSDVQDPGIILTALSRFLQTDKIGEKTILTAQILTILENGALKIASAGHPLPLLQNEAGLNEIQIDGAIPGLDPQASYSSTTLNLKAGERLMLYTDGLMEVGADADAMEVHECNIKKHIKAQHSTELNNAATEIWNYFSKQTDSAPNDDTLFILLQRD